MPLSKNEYFFYETGFFVRQLLKAHETILQVISKKAEFFHNVNGSFLRSARLGKITCCCVEMSTFSRKQVYQIFSRPEK